MIEIIKSYCINPIDYPSFSIFLNIRYPEYEWCIQSGGEVCISNRMSMDKNMNVNDSYIIFLYETSYDDQVDKNIWICKGVTPYEKLDSYYNDDEEEYEIINSCGEVKPFIIANIQDLVKLNDD